MDFDQHILVTNQKCFLNQLYVPKLETEKRPLNTHTKFATLVSAPRRGKEKPKLPRSQTLDETSAQ